MMTSEYEYEYEYTLSELPNYKKLKLDPAALHDWDDLDVKLGLITAEELAVYENWEPELSKDLTGITEIAFGWDWTANDLRYGEVKHSIGEQMIWGLKTVNEFKHHLNSRDYSRANQWREALTDQLIESSTGLGEFKMCYWVAKNKTGQTVPGFWAISVDITAADTRNILFWANGDTHVRSGLQRSGKTFLRIKSPKRLQGAK
jgi:hypothetical protein